MTAAEVARRLRLYRSNLSAMDAGTRSVSLKGLARVARLLDCSPGDLIEVRWATERPIFREARLNELLRKRELEALEGSERGWVHAALLAWQRHYGVGRANLRRLPFLKGRSPGHPT
jgi:DNA-binding Xre family transcriptional regulator